MADPDKFDPFHEEPHYNPYTNDFTNMGNYLNPSLDKDKDVIMDIGSSYGLNMFDLYNDQCNAGYSQVNQLETKFGDKSLSNLKIPTIADLDIVDQESFSLPLPNFGQSGDYEKNKGTATDISGILEDPVPEDSQSDPSFDENKGTAIDISGILEDPVPEYSQSEPSFDDWAMSDESVNNPINNHPNPEDLPFQEEPFTFPCLITLSSKEKGKAAIDPLQGTIISKSVFSPGSSSKASTETSNLRETNLGTQTLGNMNSNQFSVWPSGPAAAFCCDSSCKTLREITHMKGDIITLLRIHGSLGSFFHAILYEQHITTEEVSYEMFNLQGNSIGEVKQFLTQYCINRRQDGYIMLKDPHSSFFEALCVGLDWVENLVDGDSTKTAATASNEAENSNNMERRPFCLKEQRKRSKNLSFEDISPYFHLTRKEAAKMLGFSETVVRNALSKSGENIRWPSRKIQSLEKKISELTPLLESNDPEQREYARLEIERKKKKIAECYKEGAKSAKD